MTLIFDLQTSVAIALSCKLTPVGPVFVNSDWRYDQKHMLFDYTANLTFDLWLIRLKLKFYKNLLLFELSC